MAQLKPYKGNFYLWDYVPSLAASTVLATVFSILTAAHLWRMVRSKLWFCIPFAVGGKLMIVGFVIRALCHDSSDSLILYILQSVFLVVPPAFFAATLYMSYTRVVRSVGREDCSLIPAGRSTRVFLWADVTCINVQGGGAGLLANQTRGGAVAKAGQYILVAGLVLHIAVSVCFVVLCGSFHGRYRAWLDVSGRTAAEGLQPPWRQTLVMLYVCSAVITGRNVFRAVEYVMGREGYLMANKWPIYVMDFAPMVLVMIAFFVWYPGRLVGGGGGAAEGTTMELLDSRDGSAEVPVVVRRRNGETGESRSR